MDPLTNWQFGGIENPELPVQLQSISAINENTLEVLFNRALTDNDVTGLRVPGVTDNGSNVSLTEWKTFVQRKPGGDRTVTVQIRTSDSSPALFRPGHVYTARITGVANLDTTNNANQQTFAGTEVENRDPYVTNVVPLIRTSVKVVFSEPVKNVSKAAFQIRLQDGAIIDIESDGLNNTGKIVTEVILKLQDNLEAGKKYVMTFQPGITDAAGWNGLQIKEGTLVISVVFDGVS
jgi:methionine-rich copper-binding protein CopC